MLRIILLSFFISASTQAEESPHRVGIEYSYASVDKRSTEETSELNDVFTSHYAYTYQYEVAEYFSMGLGYLKGDSSDAEGIIIDLFTDSKIDYSALLISAEVDLPISERSYLYLKVSALQYDYDIIDDNEIVYNNDGNDWGYAFGWIYEFDNGLGIKTGFETLNFGKNITIKGINAGISYRF
jgi:hypothetical protein